MKITSAEFVASAVKSAQFPKDMLPEIALIGRSNVGKSSLINTFVNRKGLAHTSSQPGKTQTINFYRINRAFYIVDLPGFGYAKVPQSIKKDWEKMIGDYLKGRETLAGALVILDPRRDPNDLDRDLFDWLNGLEVAYSVIFTKSDKLSRNQLSSRIAAIKKEIPVHGHIVFSSLSGEGKIPLGKRISEMVEESGG